MMEEEEPRIVCPECLGDKTVLCYVTRRGRCSQEALRCWFCQAAGAVSVAQAERRLEGRRMRRERVAYGVTLRERAADLGISVVKLGQVERGLKSLAEVLPQEDAHG